MPVLMQLLLYKDSSGDMSYPGQQTSSPEELHLHPKTKLPGLLCAEKPIHL